MRETVRRGIGGKDAGKVEMMRRGSLTSPKFPFDAREEMKTLKKKPKEISARTIGHHSQRMQNEVFIQYEAHAMTPRDDGVAVCICSGRQTKVLPQSMEDLSRGDGDGSHGQDNAHFFSDQCPRLGKSGQDPALSPISPGDQLPTCLDLSPAMFARRFV
ncbi:hypothetical protein RRG08_034394 [Elysia crispata]|uniref:Uncharacterized protein n=1 Tax=Elysia crispata TaxID=231223 RepID=A0AAE0YDC7_9GAST|nr:hypothetical protein RRG08_034394 [Elysia crispata]